MAVTAKPPPGVFCGVDSIERTAYEFNKNEIAFYLFFDVRRRF
ncbi:hypothetical protein AXX16_3178 [Serratia rubidaea]|nr:hypothetical protein AXX16_3178 [Serratia rubidaea]